MNTQDAAGYAYWIAPDGSSKVIYALSTFHEIEVIVTDGYRRIPYGGIETGGLLFGKKQEDLVRVEAYRPIECQHAFGPSFVLSEADLAALREQLDAAASDPELAGLSAVGWFIGHTRGPLQMSDREALWFDQFFPAAGSLTVLIKPERFQPTRFRFFVRDRQGRVARNGTSDAVILPLSGQAPGSPDDLLPSVAAPAMEPKVAEPAPPATVEEERVEPAPPPEQQPAEPILPVEPVEAKPAIVESPPKPVGEPTRVRPPVIPVTGSPPVSPPTPPSGFPPARPQAAGDQPAPPAYPYASLASKRAQAERARQSSGLNLRSAAILLIAAVLGCAAGYWAYLQLPSPVIPVSVREDRGQLVVEWPSAQTQGVDYAALQVNNGQWITLSPEEKTAGHSAVSAPPSGDVRIDLLAKHWLRDSRGIVRYIRTAKPRAPITPVR